MAKPTPLSEDGKVVATNEDPKVAATKTKPGTDVPSGDAKQDLKENIAKSKAEKTAAAGKEQQNSQHLREQFAQYKRTEGPTKEEGDWVLNMILYGMIAMMGLVMAFMFYQIQNPGPRVPRPMVVELADDKIFTTVLYPQKEEWDQGGPNGPDVKWAVFFYKPYCGACRRIKPTFEALGKLTNFTSHLRFAAIDCVKYRVFCDRVGVDAQPKINLYHHRGKIDSRGRKEREVAAQWGGLLIGYEILAWFKEVQNAGFISEEVDWPDLNDLATHVLEYKKAGTVQHDELLLSRSTATSNPSGFMDDAESALIQSLTDAVFKGQPTLKGPRRRAMVAWLVAVSQTFPTVVMRERVLALKKVVNSNSQWVQSEYEAAVDTWLNGTKPEPRWSWCKQADRAEESGIGGYTCGLWVLFHTMMANSDKDNGGATLHAIHGWIKNLFGCSDCAKHFEQMWESENGAEAASLGPIDATQWLWKAHNMVNARLAATDDTTAGKLQWPAIQACNECYTPDARGEPEPDYEAPPPPPLPPSISTSRWTGVQWSLGNVFVLHQEVYCYMSDTFACSQFYDPSRNPDNQSFLSSTLGQIIIVAFSLVAVIALCVFL